MTNGVIIVSWIAVAVAIAAVLVSASLLLQMWADRKTKEGKHAKHTRD